MLSNAWFWRIEASAAVVAIAALLGIHDYQPGFGPLWNVMHGEIYLTSDCSDEAVLSATHGGLPTAEEAFGPDPNKQPWWDKCGRKIPSRLALLIGFAIAGSGFAFRRYPPSVRRSEHN